MIDKIRQYGAYDDKDINQVIINKYNDNTNFLPEHSDNETSIKPQSRIITISVGAPRDIVFKDGCSGKDLTFPTADRSLYIMAQESQQYWTHRMEKEESTKNTRYSFTFRTVGSYYKNSTVILGDSNTKYLKFGSGTPGEKGTFGYHLPGSRMETFHIREINPRSCLGYHLMC